MHFDFQIFAIFFPRDLSALRRHGIRDTTRAKWRKNRENLEIKGQFRMTLSGLRNKGLRRVTNTRCLQSTTQMHRSTKEINDTGAFLPDLLFHIKRYA